MFGFGKRKSHSPPPKIQFAHIQPEALTRYEPFHDLEESHLRLVHHFIDEKIAQAGELIIHLGENDDTSYFLVSGQLEMISQDDQIRIIDEKADTARFPISDLRPHRYHIRAQGPVHYFVLDNSVLHVLVETKNRGLLDSPDSGMALSLPDDPTHTGEFLLQEILDDLAADQLILPSLPKVAIDISRAINDEETNADKIADILQMDPAIAAKVMHAANSALYSGQSKVDNCHGAVVRLGFQTINRLVIAFALKEVFLVRNQALQQWMEDLWHHSLNIAALTQVLALDRQDLNPDKANLAGLLHDIGVLTILGYADRVVGISIDIKEMRSIASKIHCQIGAKVLEAWAFEPDIIAACRHAENWTFQPTQTISYLDLVIAAQRLDNLDKHPDFTLPAIEEIPVFQRLYPDGLPEEEQLSLVTKAKEKLSHLQYLFS
jgi:HD-like signal output (HDOD) protein